MPKVEVNLDQLAKALEELSPGELETLEILLNPELRAELKDRWAKAKREFEEGKTLSTGGSRCSCRSPRASSSPLRDSRRRLPCRKDPSLVLLLGEMP